MKWYWWILLIIMGLNALVIVMVGLFLLFDRWRNRRAMENEEDEEAAERAAH
jgi:uncharacterized membrane protein